MASKSAKKIFLLNHMTNFQRVIRSPAPTPLYYNHVEGYAVRFHVIPSKVN